MVNFTNILLCHVHCTGMAALLIILWLILYIKFMYKFSDAKTTLALIACQEWRSLESSLSEILDQLKFNYCQAQLLVQSVRIFGIFCIKVTKSKYPQICLKMRLLIPNITKFYGGFSDTNTNSTKYTLETPNNPKYKYFWLFGTPNCYALGVTVESLSLLPTSTFLGLLWHFVVSSFEQWSPSPIPTTSDGITQGVGQLEINSTAKLNSTARTAQKPERQRGRPRKPISKEESQRRQR